MTALRSALLTVAGRGFEGLDVDSFASALGAEKGSIEGLDTLSDVVKKGDELRKTVIRGTGDTHFDAMSAAALGVPLVIVGEDPALGLAVRHAEALKAEVVSGPSLEGLAAKVGEASEPVMSASVFEYQLLEKAKAAGAHIVLPEGDDDRILTAAGQLLDGKIAKLTILGDPEKITARAAELGVDLSEADLINHETSPLAEEFAADFAELRKSKGVTLEQARETMKDISYFATMMVHKGLADGMVSGAAHTTAHTIKPSFQIIKTKPGASVVSSIFLMVFRDRLWAFGDCAVNPNPTAEQLGEIAGVSAQTAAQFGIDPRVAILSYSTGTSGAGPDVDRAAAAVEAARAFDADLKVDGPLQFDAAVDMGVAKKKMPDSDVAGRANVFIFPDLEAGNIAYKTAQRTANALAVGPVLQGLNKPINDLSRGATVPDIVNTVAITAIQAGVK
ncbi:phosphotransacetylase [Corynebacterium phocae]|uniref:Phosphate acetyltransferase n=1 Tax=Corynebacterium phocae TaxID=161895 RepID=A0A1L7D5A6_9CORY|nr:phosphate acetyltransferase [Corynebacterium phocae]APT93318.1 phosphotransacetylase [Corynebacterium phocae]KAA8721649.1 phosphate acetyltransferase [Corynebacterium phocae]